MNATKYRQQQQYQHQQLEMEDADAARALAVASDDILFSIRLGCSLHVLHLAANAGMENFSLNVDLQTLLVFG